MNIDRSRRSFLKAVGAGAASLPFFKLLEHSAVYAQAAVAPMRFVGVYHPHGKPKTLWSPRAGFDINFEGATLQPFQSFKDQLLVLDGFSLVVAKETNTAAHGAASSFLTGHGGAGDAPAHESIDFFLSQTCGLGAANHVPVLQLGCDYEDSPEWRLSFSTNGGEIPKIVNPLTAFNHVFAGVVIGDDPEAQAELLRKQRRGQSLIDYMRGSISRLMPRLASPEQVKLDQHLTSLRDLEKRLQGTVLPTTCQKPGEPVFPSGYNKNNQSGNYSTHPYNDFIMDSHVEIMAQAIACDLTRFSTLWLGDKNEAFGIVPEDVHNEAAHTCWGGGGETEAEAQLKLSHAIRYHYSKVAKLAERLQQLDVLKDTLIFVGSDIGDPAGHTTHDVPMLMLGGASGKFQMGRHIKAPSDCANGAEWCANPKFTSHCGMLVAICNAFGDAYNNAQAKNVTSFGVSNNAETIAGPYPGLR